jgi:hypothetical protein
MALPQDGQDANGLTKVTQIPAGKELMFIDPTTNEGGIITLEDLTKQILNGLASQAFALDAGQMTLLAALNKLNSDKVSYTKYVTVSPEKESSLILDDASTYLVCYAGIDADNVKNIGFSVVISRSSSRTKGSVLNIKTEIPQIKLSLNENVLKITATTWGRISAIKL